MAVHHHVSDELLLDYAAGTLAEGWSLAVATHLALCPECRHRLKTMEATGAALMESAPLEISAKSEIDVSWAVMQKRLGQSQKGADIKEKTRGKAAGLSGPVLPEPLRSYVGGDVDGLRWKALGRGAYHIPIRTQDGETNVRLLRIPAGKPVPEHSHGGRELTLVLKGSFHDETGEFRRGDLEDADDTLEHQPIAGKDEDCICLAVTDAPLRFKSRLLRFIQPVLGI
ncbi:ChrR family anti-sigma-E factor [Allorhizobium sp. BGMRC 0089]|uniref:ChrR family anti-sigma-E factor n=1 Tax=Allorhizobium sonneratiae TaxID=2934936 RepID=UPI002033D76F|nr:ChrR family anti-sigma-E factor [Allorhizobium sonneratiae]MCM2291799.1 ChrR family anti-sigma-E factor [Allorhizobium sonneratiae]